MAQTLIVIDVPPLENAAWVSQVFAKANLKEVSNKAIAKVMSQDADAKKALLATKDPVTEAETLAPHYKKAFDTTHGGDARVGLYGSAWLVYTPGISALIIDWDEVERLATTDKQGTERVPYDHFRKQARDFIGARVKNHLAADKLLELPAGLTADQKVEASLKFLRDRSLL